MTGRTTLLAAFVLASAAASGDLAAQAPGDRPEPVEQSTPATPGSPGTNDALRRQVERRFDPLPLRDGIALRPRAPIQGVRSIELTGGTIAIDGAAVTGAELRSRLGDSADLIIQLSYLDAAAQKALFTAPPPSIDLPPPGTEAPQEPVERETRRRGRFDQPDWGGNDRVRLGESITVRADEVVNGDVAAIGGSVRVEGIVHGEVVAVGGDVDLGPRAVVDEDITVVGGVVRRADGARVDGSVTEVGLGSFARNWTWPAALMRWPPNGFGSTLNFVSTLTRGVVEALLAALVVLLAGPYVERIGSRAAAEPFKAGAVGVLAQILFLPLLVITIVVLVVTLIGIPLLALIPFAIIALAVVFLVGFAAVARQIGEGIGRHLGWVSPGPYLTTFAGVAAVLLPVLLARLALLAGGTGVSFFWHTLAFVGLCVEYLVWTVGFGAVALSRFGRGRSPGPALSPGV